MSDTAEYRLVFGYRQITGIPPCPCGTNHMSMELRVDDPLAARMRCWCGATNEGRFDDHAELEQFLAANGVTLPPSVSIGSPQAGYPCPKDGTPLELLDGGAWCPQCQTVWREVDEVKFGDLDDLPESAGENNP